MSALKYWIWLTTLKGVSVRTNLLALEHFGSPERIWLAEKEELESLNALPQHETERYLSKSLDRAELLLGECERQGIRVLTIQDAAYPDRLKSIYDPPCVLYVRGTLPEFDEEPALCAVGTRRASVYGINIARRISAELSKAGMLMISGLAEGIDTAVHEGTIRAGCPSVSVLGCGIDVVYPKSNARLYEDVCAFGAVISEYPPGEPVSGSNFPRRNRIMSGLSLGTLVVEAPMKSGAMITASHALEQGRDVFAIPGNIDQAGSAGCNYLIKQGAKLVTGSEDILEEYIPLFKDKIIVSQLKLDLSGPHLSAGTDNDPEDRKKEKNKNIKKENNAELKPKILDISDIIKDYSDERKAIVICIAGRPLNIDQITSITGLSPQTVLSELTMLEIDGLAESLPGNRFVFKKPE